MSRSRAAIVAMLALSLATALAGQALADSLVPQASGAETDRAIGRAASSYLTGLKSYAAAVLWIRTDTLLHDYYGDVPLDDQRYMMTTIAMVEMLDPHLVQPYYVGAWILVRNGKVEEGTALARRGIEANPRAGILRVNLAQILMLYGGDVAGAAAAAEAALAPDTQWTDPVERHNAYPILGSVFRAAGRDDLDAIVQAELVRLDAELGDRLDDEDHDHDHDGVADH